MRDAFICDGVRTPVGRYGGALAAVRTDDLGAVPLRALLARYPQLDLERIDDVIFGCANQAGEDNRNVARMSSLLAGLPQTVSGTTINRLCGSGLDAIGFAARAIKAGDGELLIAGVLPGFRRRAGHIKEAIGDFDVGREKLAGHLIPQQLIGNETKRGQILRVARVMDSLPAAECVASPASRASVVKLTGTVPLTILR